MDDDGHSWHAFARRAVALLRPELHLDAVSDTLRVLGQFGIDDVTICEICAAHDDRTTRQPPADLLKPDFSGALRPRVRNRDNYRLRMLLIAGCLTHPNLTPPPQA